MSEHVNSSTFHPVCSQLQLGEAWRRGSMFSQRIPLQLADKQAVVCEPHNAPNNQGSTKRRSIRGRGRGRTTWIHPGECVMVALSVKASSHRRIFRPCARRRGSVGIWEPRTCADVRDPHVNQPSRGYGDSRLDLVVEGGDSNLVA